MHSEEQDSNETDNLLKFDEKPQLMKTVKFTVITKKTTIRTTADHATAIHEKFNFIKCTTLLGRSRYLKTRNIFYPNFQFTRKLRLIYHYGNSNIIIKSSTNITNENADLENICKELEHTKVSLFKAKDNLQTLRRGLDSLSQIIEKKRNYCQTCRRRFNCCYYVPRLLLKYMSVPCFRYITL